MRWLRRAAVAMIAITAAIPALAASTSTSSALAPAAQQISSDPYADPTTMHATEVEPSVATFGKTIVATFEAGRGSSGGSTNIGWATSTDGGATWQHGFLPSLTSSSTPAGSYARASNPSVAFDAAHGVWLIATTDIVTSRGRFNSVAISVSRSTDGFSWSAPVTVTASGGPDLSWIACDDFGSSPKRGTCYVTWIASQPLNRLLASASSDGGRTWTTPAETLDSSTGLDPQAIVKPDGTVVAVARKGGTLIAYGSTNGGASWSTPVTVSHIAHHSVGSGLRESPKPSLGVDAGGNVFAVWSDCRYRTGCTSNDIVLAVSNDAVHWPGGTRIGLDSVTSSVDHFLPGLSVDPTSRGGRARLALVYYFYPVADCGLLGKPDCQLSVGFSTSRDGGASWSKPVTISAAPFSPLWLPFMSNGRMISDQSVAATFGGQAVVVYATGAAPSGSALNVSMHAAVAPLPASRSLSRVAIVRANGSFSLSSSTLRSDTYTIVVRDRSRRDNFRIVGPGLDKKTGLGFTGTVRWKLKLLPGTYTFGDERTKKTAKLEVF